MPVVAAIWFVVYYGIFRFAITRFNLKTPGRDAETATSVEQAVAGTVGKSGYNVITRFTHCTGNGLFHAGGGFGIAAWRFQVKAGNGEAEDTVVHHEPDRRHDRHQIPLGGQTMQDAELPALT